LREVVKKRYKLRTSFKEIAIAKSRKVFKLKKYAKKKGGI